MIKAVLFDAIDTLFSAYPDKIGMYQRIIKEVADLDVSYDEMKKVWDEIIKETENAAKVINEGDDLVPIWEGFNSKILQRLGYKKNDIDKKGETLRLESWTNPENFCLFPDVRPTLEKLSEQNIILGCVSNEAAGLINFFTHFDIDEYFQTIVISEVVGVEKPSLEIFNIALDNLSLDPDEVIFVGDSPVSDYWGAKEAGLYAILIDREKKINDNSVCKINKLDELLNTIKEGDTYANTAS